MSFARYLGITYFLGVVSLYWCWVVGVYGVSVSEEIVYSGRTREALIYVTVKRLLIAYSPNYLFSVELGTVKALELVKEPRLSCLLAG